MELLGHRLWLTRYCQSFAKWLYQFIFLPAANERSKYSKWSRKFSLNCLVNNVFAKWRPRASGEAVDYGRNHTHVKPQVKHAPVLKWSPHYRNSTDLQDHFHLGLGSFCGFHEKYSIHHILSGVSLCQAQDQLWVMQNTKMHTRVPWMHCFQCWDWWEQGLWPAKGLGRGRGKWVSKMCKKSSWPQSGIILFQAARLSWQNSPNPKGAKGKAVLGPLWASHLAAWQHTPTASASLLPATLHYIKVWAGLGW